MDPNACWRELCDALRDGRLDTAYECADNLLEWLGKGGARPDVWPKVLHGELHLLGALMELSAGSPE